MQTSKEKNPQQENTNKGHHEHPLPQEISGEVKKSVERAHEQAEQDIEEDPDLSSHSHNANEDLDEAEAATLGDDGNPIE